MSRKLFNNKMLMMVSMGIIITGAIASCKKKEDTDPTTNTPAQTKAADTIDCNNAIKNGGTFANDPEAAVDYVVTCQLSLNGDVTIEPGTVIEFTTDAGLAVADNGSLSINGTKDEPVLLTGTDKTTGSWKGLLFDSDDTKNSMSYTTVEYAGGAAFNSNDDLGAVIIWSNTKLKMDNCTVKQSAAYGLNANYGGAELTLTNNTFTQNDMPARFKGELLHLPTGNND